MAKRTGEALAGEETKQLPEVLEKQVVGNIGLYYVCYRLSQLGWNVMPTSRNARGIDVLIYNQDASETRSVQVKALSKSSPVPLGSSTGKLFGDFFIVCRHAVTDTPECFILKPGEVQRLAHRGDREGRVSHWLQPKDYSAAEFREAWNRIGLGFKTTGS